MIGEKSLKVQIADDLNNCNRHIKTPVYGKYSDSPFPEGMLRNRGISCDLL